MESGSRTLWHPYDDGKTIGQAGSEDGTILLDDEYDKSMRITLERGTRAIPFAITCGIDGWLVHTRYCSKENEAKQLMAEMKIALERIYDSIPSDADATEERLTQVVASLHAFIERNP